MSCGSGHRRGPDPMLLWFRGRPAAVAPIQAWALPHAAGMTLKSKTLGKKKKGDWQTFLGVSRLPAPPPHPSSPPILLRFCSLSLSFPHQVAMLICAGFLVAWIPYAVVSVWSAFGRPDSIPIQLSVVPTLLAKSAAMYNPIIYQVIDYKFACCQTGGLKATKKKSLEDFR